MSGRLWAVVAVVVAAVGSVAWGGVEKKAFEKEVTRAVRYPYLAYTPEGYARGEGKKWPVVVFLHGIGERGVDVEKVKAQGLPKLLAKGRAFPFVVVAPQCPADSWWRAEDLDLLLDHVLAEYDVDADRVYLTGLSMGGYGVWEWACRSPGRFAAIAPVCGGGNLYLAKRNLKMPVWAFHGSRDDVIPMEDSVRLVEGIRAAGGDAKLTVFPDARHDSWTAAYDMPELYDWMLSHRRKGTELTNPATTRAAVGGGGK